MTALVICFVVSFGLVTLLAVTDKRHPDRLNRHGRQLTGIPTDAPIDPEREHP